MIDVKQRSGFDTALDPRPSRSRRDGRPSVSVVFIARDDLPATLREISDRSARWQRWGVEVVVVSATRQTTPATVALLGGEARIIYGMAGATESELRAAGLTAASGDVVMMVDECDGADDVWIEQLALRRDV